MTGNYSEPIFILKQGLMKTWNKNQFEEYYYIVHKATDKNVARLDWYKSKNDFHNSASERKCVFLEEIRDIESRPYDSEMKKKYPVGSARPKHLMIINTFRQEKQYVMMFENKTEMEDWKSVLQDVLQNVKERSLKLKKLPVDRKDDEDYLPRLPAGTTFPVEIGDTARAIQCNLRSPPYYLISSREHLSLMDATGDVSLTWKYKLVRRFGYSDQTFTVEGGSRCGSGEGLFIFENCPGREIMNEVTERMKAIPKTVAEESDIYSEVPATDEPPTYVDIGSKRITNLPQRPLPVSPPLGPPPSVISNLAQMADAHGKKLTEAMANYKQVVVSKSPAYSKPIEDDPADEYEELPCDSLEEPPPRPVQSKPQPAPKSKAAAQPQQKTFNPPPAKSAKPKMSEVLKALSIQNARGQKPLDPEDQTYSQLDIKMEKVNRRESDKMDSNENLYGQQLIQHQNTGFGSTDDYTEISTGDKKGMGKR